MTDVNKRQSDDPKYDERVASAFGDFLNEMSKDKKALRSFYRRLMIRGALLVIVAFLPVFSYVADTC